MMWPFYWYLCSIYWNSVFLLKQRADRVYWQESFCMTFSGWLTPWGENQPHYESYELINTCDLVPVSHYHIDATCSGGCYSVENSVGEPQTLSVVVNEAAIYGTYNESCSDCRTMYHPVVPWWTIVMVSWGNSRWMLYMVSWSNSWWIMISAACVCRDRHQQC